MRKPGMPNLVSGREEKPIARSAWEFRYPGSGTGLSQNPDSKLKNGSLPAPARGRQVGLRSGEVRSAQAAHRKTMGRKPRLMA